MGIPYLIIFVEYYSLGVHIFKPATYPRDDTMWHKVEILMRAMGKGKIAEDHSKFPFLRTPQAPSNDPSALMKERLGLGNNTLGLETYVRSKDFSVLPRLYRM